MKRIVKLLIWLALFVSATALASISTDTTKTGVSEGIIGPLTQSVYISPQANAQNAINAAISNCGGNACTLLFGSGVYSFTGPVNTASGAALFGVHPQFTNSNNNNVFDAGKTYLSGTEFLGDGVHDCIDGNATNVATPPAINAGGFGNNTLSNISIKHIYFKNCNYPVKIGAINNMGAYGGSFRDLWFSDNVQAADWENFVHSRFHDLFAYDSDRFENGTCAAPYAGGIRFAASVGAQSGSLPADIPGNSTFGHIADMAECRLNKHIRFVALGTADVGGTAPAMLNELHVSRIETLQFGQSQDTETATVTGSGSPNIVLPAGKGVLYPPGVLVQFTTTNYGLFAGQEYCVTTESGDTITVATTCPTGSTIPTALTFSSGGSITLNSGGYPLLALNSTAAGQISNMQIGAIDHETGASGGSVGIYGQNLYNVQFTLSGTTGLWANNIALHGNETFVMVYSNNGNGTSGVSTDFSSDTVGFNGVGRGVINDYPGYGCWNGMCLGYSSLSLTVGAAAQIGSGGTCTFYPGGKTNLSNSNNGVIYITTGTGTLTGSSTAPVCTLTSNPAKPYMTAFFMPMNEAALGVSPPVHANFVIRSGSVDIDSDTALAPSTTYIFEYFSP